MQETNENVNTIKTKRVKPALFLFSELMDKYDSHLEEVRSDHEADIQTYVDRNAELQAKYEEVCGEYEQIRAEVEKANQEQTDQYLSQIAR